MQYEFCPEKLIDEVKARPALWDPEIIEHRNPRARIQMWSEIARTMANVDNFSDEEMSELGVQLQKKWKGIRDAYLKYLAKPNRKKYIYTNQLGFLESILRRNAKKGADGESRPKKVKKGRKTMSNDLTDEDETDDGHSNDQEDSESNMTVTVPSFAFTNVADAQPPSSYNTSDTTDSNDCDRLFLLSLLPHLKTIPEVQRLNVKVEIMQLINRANQGYYPDRKLL